jgi:uncharacterized protein (UPF0332 family)
MNRLYYASFYAVSALVLLENQSAYSHNGVKIFFSEKFIKTGRLELSHGKLFSQLFTWRQKGDYDDLFDFDGKTVAPYLEPVKKRPILKISEIIESSLDKSS